MRSYRPRQDQPWGIARDPLGLPDDFDQLSITDLLRARDTYHFHLMSKENVVGTALGYYLIRDSERRPDQIDPKNHGPPDNSERTFWNSSVREYSWPCVLVMVSKWEDVDQFGTGMPYDPTDMVPRTLYLDDGLAVPVCLVAVKEANDTRPPVQPPAVAPNAIFGGGQPVTVTTRGVVYTATVG